MSDIRVRVGGQNAIKVVSSSLTSGIPEAISDLSDINITPPIENGNILTYDSTIGKWKNSDELDGGSY